MVLVMGATSLIVLRRWGWSRIEDEHARVLFAQTRETFDRGDVIQAQKTLVRLLKIRPDRLTHAVSVFDTDMLGMPAALAEVHASPNNTDLSPIDQLRQAIIHGGAQAAYEKLDAMKSNEENDRAAALWNARLLLMDGEFSDANERFDGFWAGYPDERRETIELLTPEDADLNQRGASAADKLFRLGLWDEAAEVAENAQTAGAQDPGLGFYIARQAERDEGRLAAIAQYDRVLQAFPNHDLALRRVQKLSRQDW